MSEMSRSAIMFALDDARNDILLLSKLLCMAAYPRRGTEEEFMTLADFASKVQAVISHADSVELI